MRIEQLRHPASYEAVSITIGSLPLRSQIEGTVSRFIGAGVGFATARGRIHGDVRHARLSSVSAHRPLSTEAARQFEGPDSMFQYTTLSRPISNSR